MLLLLFLTCPLFEEFALEVVDVAVEEEIEERDEVFVDDERDEVVAAVDVEGARVFLSAAVEADDFFAFDLRVALEFFVFFGLEGDFCCRFISEA